MIGMRHRKRPRIELDEFLTGVFGALVIAGLIVGVISQLHA
jgi:hypothetical protein